MVIISGGDPKTMPQVWQNPPHKWGTWVFYGNTMRQSFISNGGFYRFGKIFIIAKTHLKLMEGGKNQDNPTQSMSF